MMGGDTKEEETKDEDDGFSTSSCIYINATLHLY